MDIQDLRVALAVARAGSYNRAADELGVSHQAVSKTMRALERQLRGPIFARSSGKAAPTDFGRRFLEDAESVCRDFSRLEDDYGAALPAARAGEGQSLRVALVVGGNAGLPAGFFNNYTLAHPDVALVIEEMNSDRVLDAVGAGEFDVGILGTHPSLVADYESKAIVRMGVWLLVPQDHPLAQAPQSRGIPHVGLTALDRLPMVTAGSTNHLPRFVLERCRQAGVAPHVVATSTDGVFMQQLSRERKAVCFAFDPRIRKPPQGSVAVRVDFPSSDEFGTYALRRAGGRHSPAAASFWGDELPLIGG